MLCGDEYESVIHIICSVSVLYVYVLYRVWVKFSHFSHTDGQQKFSRFLFELN